MLNLLSGDAAEKYFGISERDLDKELLYLHFMQHYDAVLGSLQSLAAVRGLDEATRPPPLGENRRQRLTGAA